MGEQEKVMRGIYMFGILISVSAGVMRFVEGGFDKVVVVGLIVIGGMLGFIVLSQKDE